MKTKNRIVQTRCLNRIVEFIFIIIFFTSCILQLGSRKFNDGSTTLTHSDSLFIHPFNENDFTKEYAFGSPSDITFQVIDAQKIGEILTLIPHTWITIGASWCPVSQQSLIKFNRIAGEFNSDSLRWIFISQDYNISRLQQQLFDAGLTHISYLLDSEKYGKDEVSKQEKFAKDLSTDLPVYAFKGGGVPISLLINSKLQIEYIFKGIKVNEDSIMKYTSLHINNNTK